MSGGYFDYNQYWISSIEDKIEGIIRDNLIPDKYGDYWNFSNETLETMEVALHYLRLARIYTQRIDYLVSDDDSEETFHERLKEDLEKINEVRL